MYTEAGNTPEVPEKVVPSNHIRTDIDVRISRQRYLKNNHFICLLKKSSQWKEQNHFEYLEMTLQHLSL